MPGTHVTVTPWSGCDVTTQNVSLSVFSAELPFALNSVIILSLTVQKRKTSRISSVYAGFETFFIVNRYAYVAPSFWKNRMKGARARLSLIPGAEFSTRAYLSYKRLSYFFVCLHMFLIFAIGINSFEVSNPKAWCRESVSSLRL